MRDIFKFIITAVVFVTVSFTGAAQTGTITGVVTDRATGETLPGTNILVEGTTIGTISDENGQYELTVPAGEIVIKASFMGYHPTRLNLEIAPDEVKVVDIEMYADITMLDEFIVIGYGVQRREDATGSVSVVEARDFNRGNIVSPTDLLQGKTAGVQITTAGGAPGSSTTIRIRGGSSLSASNDPLIVVDGVPLDTRGISGMRNPLSTINPDDIESFTVLKDASATAIYGSRASNGVIIITTKKGEEGMPLRFNYQGNYTVATPIRTIDVLDANTHRELITERYQPVGGSAWDFIENNLGEHNTDWQDQIFRNAFSHDHNVSATGAIGPVPFRAAIGHTDQDGILDTDNMSRTSFSLGANPTLLDDHLTINFNLRGIYSDNTFADAGAIGAAIQFDPTQPVKDPNSPYERYYTWTQDDGRPEEMATANPVALLHQRQDVSDVYRLIGNLQLDYKFHFLPELKANLNIGYDHSNSEGSITIPFYAGYAYNEGSVNNLWDQEKKNELIEFYLNYETDLEAINSRLDVMAGYSWQHIYQKSTSLNRNFKDNLTGIDVEWNYNEFPTENYLVSFFGRMNYVFMDRYLFTFTLRNDGSSRFHEDHRWGLFPSAAFAWNIRREPFMENLPMFSELKLRLGYGVTGQQEILLGDYPYLARYTRNRQGAYYQFGDRFIDTYRPEGYDENLKWEETTTYNIGLDFGIFDDRYYGSLEFYFRETEDLINQIPVPAGTNLTNIIITNIGNLENKGVEFNINTRPIVRSDFLWYLGFNATYNVTEITKLTAAPDPSFLGVQVGGIQGGVGNTIQMHSVGHAPYSFFVYEQIYDADGNPIEGLYVDRTGDGEYGDRDRRHLKDPAPNYFFGINSTFEYKEWDLSFAGRAHFGNYVYNNVSSMNGELSRLYRPEGPYISNVTTDALDVRFNNAQYMSDYYIQDASFFKMDNITLGYNFPTLFEGKADLRMTFTVQNVFTITGYDGLDPEVGGGIDTNIYPRPRNFVMGVNLRF